jgi:hypothetical protein
VLPLSLILAEPANMGQVEAELETETDAVQSALGAEFFEFRFSNFAFNS